MSFDKVEFLEAVQSIHLRDVMLKEELADVVLRGSQSFDLSKSEVKKLIHIINQADDFDDLKETTNRVFNTFEEMYREKV